MNRLIAALLIGASMPTIATVAHAQDGAAPQDAASSTGGNNDGLAEIVVTANRTESSAQKTAVALTVYTGADLAQKGISNVQSLATVDPSVNLSTSSGSAYVAVRGIASTDVTEIGDPSVPIARDGFYTNRSFSIGTSMYDIARIEVLKGPQGTLNGRNSTGGLISLITNRPSDTAGAYGSFEVGNYRALNVEAGGNVPLTDTLAVRFSGIHRQHDGYRHLTGINLDGDDENTSSGRVQLQWKPTDNVKLWASYQHDDIRNVGDVAMVAALGTRPDFGDARSFPNQALTSNRVKGDRIRWEGTVANFAGDLTLTYAGGWDKQTWAHKLDATGPAYPAIRNFIQHEAPTTWNHEVRLSNGSNNPLFFQVGLFHFQETNTINSGIYNLAMTGPYAPGGPLSFLDFSNTYGIHFDYNVKTKSDAVFGQIAYKLGDQWKLTVGGRYTRDEKVRTGGATLNYPALAFPEWGFVFPFTTGFTDGAGRMTKSQPTWHVGLDYTPASNSLVYAKYDRGYKSGGFNSNGSAASIPYGPETLDAFEVGTKNRFMGNRLQLNASAFYFNYRGYQASQTADSLNGAAGTFNVGTAKIYGAEAQAVALFGQGGRIDLNAAWLHTRFGDNITVNDGGGTPQSIGGHQLPNAPKLSVSGGIEYAIPAFGGTLTPRADAKYSSSFYYSVFNTYDTQSRPYVTGNLSLQYAPEGARWTLQAFVRNVGDKVVLAYAAQNFNSRLNTYQFQPPRTYGVRFGFKI
ncbi:MULTISPECIES: TonB-dependent receptor [unclassified Novosphingobium]|uniref:TonB-dependent receptor n=1 Tax=unclassified Novosphingobium TaxID=2644732 RepID=UPI001440F9B9|nr:MULTISPECIES: TonB-dependent receptor [unclassified Novosphingobium]MBB3358696.1 iron complex outermembrane receptor protein [Novosphingobium sp. BK256]MBB3375057.1 iron complex outermembrane receptor protein [Novosphingobium sp. BK280]MBB3379255.1 iron complex outermembrane receptor protein [Novosphingobium sp. BK258]MBB3420949.1 iron complex outermembrane receptor protein [Novosphingobium sp. BK267]MBB3449478.1 iron complex outermembrane receptor protein [Novosphingobium sp. BK352]